MYHILGTTDALVLTVHKVVLRKWYFNEKNQQCFPSRQNLYTILVFKSEHLKIEIMHKELFFFNVQKWLGNSIVF